jgi:CRISPR-associated protein Cas5d
MYPVSFEIESHSAIFSRPDTGSTPVSYPVPTWSALKGMFEAVARHDGAYIRPTHVEICRPLQFQRYVTNYGGPLKKDNNYQLIATVLVDVCYKVYGVTENLESVGNGVNPAHALQEIFQRRMKQGRLFYMPCLGWKEFTPTYFGTLRQHTTKQKDIDIEIPSLLFSVFDRPTSGKSRPIFIPANIKEGLLEFPHPKEVMQC